MGVRSGTLAPHEIRFTSCANHGNLKAFPAPMKTFRVSAASAALLFAAASHSSAFTTYTDPFTDGDKVAGADNSGIRWYDRSTNSTLTINDTAATGLTGNALNLNLGNSSNSTPGTNVANRGFIGVLGTTFIPTAIGDSIRLSFDFQLRPTGTNVAGTTFTTAPVNAAEGITFGFYNSNGTPVTDDNQTASDNDSGIRGSFGTGTTLAADLAREANSAAGGLGTTTATDSASFVASGTSTPSAINDFNKHSAQLVLTLTALGEYTVSMMLDGNTIATATTPQNTYTRFDEIVFSQGGSNNFSIDNVVVNIIPEPSALLLGGMGALALLRRRR